MDVVVVALMVVISFNTLIQIERWLHQHIFKVGWLVSKNFQTTTILYYTFFLPGVFLYEVIYWLAAGALNVRADRSITWPEAQEVGELHLNFVKLSKKAPTWKLSLINLAPVLVGILTIWFIANNVFAVDAIADTLSEGTFSAVGDAISQLMSTTDFWLWAYLLFTVSNTMLPDKGIFKGWQWLAGAAILISIPLFFLGVGEQIIGNVLTGPIGGVLSALLLVFIVVIAFDAIAVGLLALIENTIEYITGDSAMFKNGKMIVMTREEALEQRRKEREFARKQAQKSRKPVTTQGPPSIYRIEFPLPGPPGKEPISTLPVSIIEPESGQSKIDQSQPPKREEPMIITGIAERRDIRIGPPPAVLEDNDKDQNKKTLPPKDDTTLSSSAASLGSTKDKQNTVSLRPRPSPFTGKPEKEADEPEDTTHDDDTVTYEDVDDPA